MINQLNTNEAFTALSHEELKKVAPSIFTEDKSARTSDIYAKTSTIKIVEDLAKLGWVAVRAIERKSRVDIGFQKHVVWFRNPNMIVIGEEKEPGFSLNQNVEAYPEICLINSHDGLTAFRLSLGIFRVVCQNGLSFQSDNLSNFRIVHKGYNFSELEKIVIGITEKVPHMISIIDDMKSIHMSAEDIEMYVDQAVQIRERYSQGLKIDIDLRDFVEPKREEDNGSSIWQIYNLTQEKLLQGGFKNTENNRVLKKINYLDKILWINKDLFELTEQYYEKLKSVGPIKKEQEEIVSSEEKVLEVIFDSFSDDHFNFIKDSVAKKMSVPSICDHLNISKKKYYSLLTDFQKEELNQIRILIKN